MLKGVGGPPNKKWGRSRNSLIHDVTSSKPNPKNSQYMICLENFDFFISILDFENFFIETVTALNTAKLNLINIPLIDRKNLADLRPAGVVN